MDELLKDRRRRGVNLFDASALLCFLRGEVGAEVVERELIVGGACSAANWSETAQKLIAPRQDWDQVQALLLSCPLQVEPVLQPDAELAARLWRRGSGLSPEIDSARPPPRGSAQPCGLPSRPGVLPRPSSRCGELRIRDRLAMVISPAPAVNSHRVTRSLSRQ